ncbi:MAG: hypothetical protein KBT27_06180 [Prevotellaceae bacterium]|nr:hypothetical protein [Candidatus Faecinaster equi]
MLTPEQIAKIHEKDSQLREGQQRNPLTNYREGYFHITLNVRNKAPMLGWLTGSISKSHENKDTPKIVLTQLGEKVNEAWSRIPLFYPNVETVAFQIMPEHIHGLLHLKQGNTKHLGHIVKGFMIGSSHGYWDILGLPWREQGYTKGVLTPQYNDKDHTHSFRGPALFVHGYNDVEALTHQEVAIKIEYIRTNPERRMIKQTLSEVFSVKRGITSHNWTFDRAMKALISDQWLKKDASKLKETMQKISARMEYNEQHKPMLAYVGNKSLLTTENKIPLICHRRDVELFEMQKNTILQAAREKAIVVSAFISPKENEIKKQLIMEQLPFIQIMDNGFSERYKPVGKSFYATAEGNLLQLSPWTYLFNRDSTISREMCLVMNELVRLITNKDDDWWKQANQI